MAKDRALQNKRVLFGQKQGYLLVNTNSDTLINKKRPHIVTVHDATQRGVHRCALLSSCSLGGFTIASPVMSTQNGLF